MSRNSQRDRRERIAARDAQAARKQRRAERYERLRQEKDQRRERLGQPSVFVLEEEEPSEFRPFVNLVIHPVHEPHWRTTLLGDAAKIAYIEVMRPEQVVCEHHFADLNRWGDAVCATCEAHGWSRWWVAAEVYGDGTNQWALDIEQQYVARMRAGVAACMRLCQSQCDGCHDQGHCVEATRTVGELLLCDECAASGNYGALEVVTAVEFDLEAPAKAASLERERQERRRLTVPAMAPGAMNQGRHEAGFDDPVIS